MKVLKTFVCKHMINGIKRDTRVIAVLQTMEKDGNTYEYIKMYKLDKDCPTIADGTCGTLLFTSRGKVGAVQLNG